MEHHQALPSSDLTMTANDSNNNNSMHYHHSNRRKKRTTKQQQIVSSTSTSTGIRLGEKVPIFSMSITDEQIVPVKRPLSWTKRWSKWFSACSADRRSTPSQTNPIEKQIRTKSENDVYLRQEKIEKFNRTSRTIEDYHHHHQTSIERVKNSNRDRSRRYSNPYSSTSLTRAEEDDDDQGIPIPIYSSSHHRQQSQPLSRSADRLNSKAYRRELRYEEHQDYKPTSNINYQHHHARNLNSSSHRPHSTNIPFSFTSTILNNSIKPMARRSTEQVENTYGRLSECHSPLIPLENSSIKAPRRIENAYSQFPSSTMTAAAAAAATMTTTQEPVYANTQSLYDNILYPTATRQASSTFEDKRSCASQTQLTWTMATFSSFVDLENQSIVIPQTDPSTLYSIVSPGHRSNSPNRLQFVDEPPLPSRSSKVLMIEKRDGSFQTLLSIAPGGQEMIPSSGTSMSKGTFHPDSTPSPLSTGSSSMNDGRHQHQHHRHRSRHRSRHNINTRDVGLQVNIQMVKKIAFLTDKSDESSLTTTSPSQATVIPTREMKHVQTNTDSPQSTKHDRSTSYENDLHLVTSASQTTESTFSTSRQTKSAQTTTRSLRDQAIETNNLGLFVCDLSSLLKSNLDDLPTTTTLTIKRKT